jgi:adenylate cyclase
MTASRILVVDDEPDLESLVTQKFRREIRSGEMDFLFACNGQDALSVLAENADVDIVLSDINMPIMDGLTLLGKLQELDNRLKTVIVSAYGDMRNIRSAMNLGAFDFVTKPIDFSDLELTINKTIADLQSLREIHRMRESAEKAKLDLARYFSPNLVKQLLESPDSLNLDGERRELTFVFSDLADFTPLVESLEPTVVVALLNEYLNEMTKIVFRWGGTVDKVVGDAVHAIFGAPMAQQDHAAMGVGCAMEIDRFAESFRARKQAENIPLGITRIGVHTGLAMVGNFGGDHFFDYTAHGDAINTAARLEGANKYLGTRICVSAAVVDKIPDFAGRSIGKVLLSGKTEELALYEPLTQESMESEAVQAYQRAYAKLETEDPSAKQAFAAVVGQFGDDPLATYHLKRTLAGETGIHITLSEK